MVIINFTLYLVEIQKYLNKMDKPFRISAFDDHHYADLILEYLSKFGSASRKEVDNLVWDELSNALNDV